MKESKPLIVLVGTLVFCLGLLTAGCSVNPFDDAQVPSITVNLQDEMTISWTPQGAYDVRVLEGVVDPKDEAQTRPPSTGVVWGLQTEENRNDVMSPIAFGESRDGFRTIGSGSLVPGETYTVYVYRLDPKGSGGGFTNTSNVYEAVETFVAN